MRSVRVIPCLDVMDGRVVKGVNFVGLRDAGDPAELASFYDREGADELVFLDITASHEGRPAAISLAEKVAEQVFIPFTVGGGLRTVEDIRDALIAGADKVSLNTAALADPSLISRCADRFGSQCVVLAIDARRLECGKWPGQARGSVPGLSGLEQTSTLEWEVLSHGGRNPTGRNAVEWAVEATKLGAGEILLTSMDGDGTLQGYDLDLTRAVSEAVAVPVIASGGAGTSFHLIDAVRIGMADAVLLASILHDGTHRIYDLKRDMAAANIPVRLV